MNSIAAHPDPLVIGADPLPARASRSANVPTFEAANLPVGAERLPMAQASAAPIVHDGAPPAHPAPGMSPTRRGFLVNSIVSVASLASASALASPETSEAPKQTVSASWNVPAQLARAEQMIDVLRTRHVCEGWRLDDDEAERVLGFFRQAMADPEGYEALPIFDAEFSFVVRFVMDHGQSLDWLLLGDASGLICRAAAQSPRAWALVDPETEAAIREHREAFLHYLEVMTDVPTEQDDLVHDEAAFERQEDAAIDLTNVVPETMGGVLALLNHVDEFTTGGLQSNRRPTSCYSEPGMWAEAADEEVLRPSGHPLYLPVPYWVLRNVATALQKISAEG